MRWQFCYALCVISLTCMRRIDTWLGWPLAALLGVWPQRKRALSARPGQIVIVKLSGLGSLLVCAGVLRALRASQPQARLVVVALEGTAAAARLMPEVDEVLAISAAGALSLLRDGWRVLRTLRARRVDVIADIEYFSKLSTVFCALAGARYRLGFQLPARWRGRLIDGGIAFREDIHFRECVARLLHPLGVDYRQLPVVQVTLPDVAEQGAEALLADAADGAGAVIWAAVNPHATTLCVQRRWPLERFARVMDALLQAHPELRILLPGTVEERVRAVELRARVANGLRERVCVLAGGTDVETLAAVLRRCRLVLTGDTGMMHLAATVGAPLVALFGPESPVRYGPVIGANVVVQEECSVARILQGSVPCGPCLSYMNHKRAPCGAEPAACMLAISVEQVVRACGDVLSQDLRYV